VDWDRCRLRGPGSVCLMGPGCNPPELSAPSVSGLSAKPLQVQYLQFFRQPIAHVVPQERGAARQTTPGNSERNRQILFTGVRQPSVVGKHLSIYLRPQNPATPRRIRRKQYAAIGKDTNK